MNILSWNVAGIRAMINKKNDLHNLLLNYEKEFDIVCFQETKAEENQVNLSKEIINKYPFRYWNSSQGTTQKKGFSGTSIWCKIQPIRRIPSLEIDEEGRIITLEYEYFFLICVYTPNSQDIKCGRFKYRIKIWDEEFRHFIIKLKELKPIIVTGDFNVAHQEIDLHNPKLNKNKSPGFYDEERIQFQKHLDAGFIDVFRYLNPNLEKEYTFWSRLRPTNRLNNNGWRLDYFLYGNVNKCKKEIQDKDNNKTEPIENIIITDCGILKDIMGSDHCPIYLQINFQ